MAERLNTRLAGELQHFGGDSIHKCFNCGNCTASCSLTEDSSMFPRMQIRYMQLGLEDKLLESTEAWQCYYCGSCSDTCPREAHPGELMMATRRWLTTKYDWTGLSKMMYISHAWEFAMLAIVALVVLLLFVLPSNFGFNLLAQHPEARNTMMLQYFAPKDMVHYGDLAMAALLGFLLLTNAARMASIVMRKESIPLWLYISEFYQMVVHILTQKRWSKCDNESKTKWVRHLMLVTGYATMFLLVVVFLPWFQIEDTSFHWTSILGYYATATLLAVTVWMMKDRLAKQEASHKFSHLSDWLFLILLALTSITGILMHLFRILNLPMATYIIYVVHLMIALPMLVVEVPFGKWAHLIYRPLAIYLTQVKLKAAQLRESQGHDPAVTRVSHA